MSTRAPRQFVPHSHIPTPTREWSTSRASAEFRIAVQCSHMVVPGCDTQDPLSPSQPSVGLCHTAGLGTSDRWLPVWGSLTAAAKETGSWVSHPAIMLLHCTALLNSVYARGRCGPHRARGGRLCPCLGVSASSCDNIRLPPPSVE